MLSRQYSQTPVLDNAITYNENTLSYLEKPFWEQVTVKSFTAVQTQIELLIVYMYPTGFNPSMLRCSLLLKNSLWMATGWGIFRHQVQFQPDKPPVEAPCQHERLHFSYPCKRHKPGRAQGSTILLGNGFPPKGTPRVPLTGLVPAGRRVLQLGPAHEITAPRVIMWEWSSDLVLFRRTSNNVAVETREKSLFLSFQTRFRTPNYSVSNRKLSGGVRTAGCVVRRETLLVWQGAGRLVSRWQRPCRAACRRRPRFRVPLFSACPLIRK